MVWVRLADDFPDHPKIVQAGPMAAWMWVCGLSYSNRYATDGFIPNAQVRRLADVPNPSELAGKLVEARLWEIIDGGFMIHDYATYQPSAEEVKQERAAAAARQAAYRRRRQAARDAARNDTHDPLVTRESPAPGPARPDSGPARPGLSPPPNPLPASGEGAGNVRRKRAKNGVADQTPAPPPELLPPTEDDRRVWNRALENLPQLTPSNRERIAQLEPAGRAPDGGLWLAAPLGEAGWLARTKPLLARALADAGDDAGQQVGILEVAP